MQMMLFKKDLKLLLKEIRKANRKRKPHDPLLEFVLMVKSDGLSFPGRVGFITGEAPASFWKSKQAENLSPRPTLPRRSE